MPLQRHSLSASFTERSGLQRDRVTAGSRQEYRRRQPTHRKECLPRNGKISNRSIKPVKEHKLPTACKKYHHRLFHILLTERTDISNIFLTMIAVAYGMLRSRCQIQHLLTSFCLIKRIYHSGRHIMIVHTVNEKHRFATFRHLP